MTRAGIKAGLPLRGQFGFFIALTLCCVLLFFHAVQGGEFAGKVVGRDLYDL
jgi:hypothetical protein